MDNVSIKVLPDFTGMRIDKFIRIHYSGTPQSLIEKLSRKGCITLDGIRVTGKTRVQNGQVLTVRYPLVIKDYTKQNKIPSQNITNNLLKSVVFENDDIIILNKPANLSSQGGSFVNYSVDMILRNFNSNYRLTHRIDKHTTGILVVAKNRITAAKITGAFRDHRIQKEYIALVWGVPQKNNTKIESIVTDKNTIPAITNYNILASYKDMFSIIKLYPMTGHKHQLRIHMAQLGTPIIGDDKHGNFDLDKQYKIKNLYLHAYSILMPKYNKFYARIPKHFFTLLEDSPLLDVLQSIHTT